MSGTPRPPQRRAALERQARALRAQGASMAQIERATGVPVSTLHRWAARGGWRLEDLEAAQPAPVLIPVPTPAPTPIPADQRESRDPPPGTSPDGFAAPRGPGSAAPSGIGGGAGAGTEVATGAPAPPPTPEQLRAAGEAAFAAALQLAAAGNARAAREQLLLGRRFLDAVGAVAPPGGASQVETAEEVRAELERRLLHLLDYEIRRLDRAAAAIGVESVWGLDISAFEIGYDAYRKATPQEAARIKAGDWPTLPPEPNGCDALHDPSGG